MDIKELRQDIDRIDEQLVHLFAQRMEVSAQIADYKKQQNMPIYVPAREREKLVAVSEKITPELANHVKVLYSLLFELSRSHQSARNAAQSALFTGIVHSIEHTPKLFPQQAKVACPGMENEEMQRACEHIIKNPCALYFNSLDAVFSAVEQGMCQYGLIPLEDGLSSASNAVYQLLIQRKFFIVRAFCLQNEQGGKTRYICVSKELEIYPGADRTMLMMVLPHKPGSLYRVLARLYTLDINVTRLESRPSELHDYEVNFYFELDSSIYSEEFVRLMCELDDLCEEFKYLGSYTEVV